ncbi:MULTISPECIES: peptidoglycan recognition protein [unclassified Streptomyces]|uniref:peptidoglycan recognition protein family protein n=1 Tax=unclassified Streptomyces TaxID=2593676 RepID=UPI001F03DEA1|nr:MULTISPECIES: peptidoglycan recognition protein [unclassified Streptomyces]MCH0566350.1 peptidoglycan recognition protein [Streptomyces sp. MUM 2J]MCH0571556.1 peptidoglycan recognition protein [Streptomyces sp. MUM 136J]
MSPSRCRARRTHAGGRRARPAVGTAVAAAVGLAATALAASPAHPQGTGEPRPPAAHTIELPGPGDSRRTLPRTGTDAFSLIGVTWKDHTQPFDGTAQIRTRSTATGEWSGWRDLDFDTAAPEGPEGLAPDVRGASDPRWVGPSDAVEARVTAAGGEATLPDGLRLDLVDPGTMPAAPTAPTAPGVPTGSADGTDPAPKAPAVVARSGWGADESLVKHAPQYIDKVRAVFVHHTAGSNDYTCAGSAAVIRAIFVYHVQQLGWNDIGYNFVVDKCGTVFEGRAGGTGKRVRGAHTYGFNGVSSGVSLLGDYENGGIPTAAAQEAIAGLAAWKLGLDGVDPQAQVTLTAGGDTGVYDTGERGTFHTVSGHRDGYATLCPGQALYDALPGIRAAAGASPYAAKSALGTTEAQATALRARPGMVR